jgi:hypothetical protein
MQSSVGCDRIRLVGFIIANYALTIVKVGLISLILVCSLEVAGQPQLTLFHGNRVVTRFNEGDMIRFQRKDRSIREGFVYGFSPGMIILQGDDTTFISQIRWIDLRYVSNTNFKTAPAGKNLILAGAVLLLIDYFNNTPHSIDPEFARVAAGFAGVGLLLQVVNNNKFRPGRHRRLGVIR